MPAHAGTPAPEQKEDSEYQSLPAHAGTPAPEQKEDSVYQSLPAHAASQQADQLAQQPQSNNVLKVETHLKQYEQTGDKLDGTLTQTNMGQGPDRQEMSQQAQQQKQYQQEQSNTPNMQQ